MSAVLANTRVSPRRASRIEVAADLSLSDLAVWSGISVNKLYGHIREVHDPLPAFNWGRKWTVNKHEFESWKIRRFSSTNPDPAIVAPRRRRRKSRGV